MPTNWAMSRPASSTTSTFTTQELRLADGAPSAQAGGGERFASLKGRKVLLVDDCELNLTIGKLQLRAQGLVVAYSANAFAEDREKSLKAGMDGHVAKPLVIDELLTGLKQLDARRDAPLRAAWSSRRETSPRPGATSPTAAPSRPHGRGRSCGSIEPRPASPP